MDADVAVNIIIASALAVETAVTGSGSSFFCAAAEAAASANGSRPLKRGGILLLSSCLCIICVFSAARSFTDASGTPVSASWTVFFLQTFLTVLIDFVHRIAIYNQPCRHSYHSFLRYRKCHAKTDFLKSCASPSII